MNQNHVGQNQAPVWDRIIRWSILGMTFFIPFIHSPFTDNIHSLPKSTSIQMFLCLISSFFLVRGLALGGLYLKRNAGYIFAILFGSINIFSLIPAVNKYEALFVLRSVLGFVMLAIIISETFQKESHLKMLILAMMAGGLGTFIYDVVIHQGIHFDLPRTEHKALLGHYNYASEYMLTPFLISVGMMFAPTRPMKIFAGFVALVCGLFLLVAQTRGVWLGSLGGIFLVYTLIVVWGGKSLGKWMIRLLRMIPLVLVLLFAVVLLVSNEKSSYRHNMPESVQGFTDRFISIFDPDNYARKTRLLVWKDTVSIIKDAPLLGHGIGNFKVEHMKFRSTEERGFTGKGIKYVKAHNEYLNIMSETGVLGIGVFMLLIGHWGWSLFALFKSSDRAKRFYVYCFGGVFVGCLIQGLFGYVLLTVPAGAWMFWATGGMIWAGNSIWGSGKKSDDVWGISLSSKQIFRRMFILCLTVCLFLYAFSVVPRRWIGSRYIKDGIVHYRRENLNSALRDLHQAEEWYFADEQIGFFLGRIHQRNGEKYRKENRLMAAHDSFEKAIEKYKKALKLYPYYEIILNNLGAVYTLDGQIDRAYEIYQTASKINPLHAGTRMNLAMYYWKKKMIPEAKEQVDLIRKIDSKFFEENPQFIKYRDDIERQYGQIH
ncbi:O-antigen ligase family protein [PVC group bacterium]|nr:O-antigen ligase family protein [PVC group bacterium]